MVNPTATCPNIVLARIFYFNEIKKYPDIALVCKKWKNAVSHDTLWHLLADEMCPGIVNNSNLSWKELVRRNWKGFHLKNINFYRGDIFSAWGNKITYWKHFTPYVKHKYSIHRSPTDHRGAINCFKVRIIGISTFMLTGGGDGYVKVWVKMNEQFHKRNEFEAHNSPVTVIAALGQRIFTGSEDNTVKVWYVQKLDEQINHECTLEGHTGAIQVMLTIKALDGSVYTGSTDKTIRVWKRVNQNYVCAGVLKGHEDSITCLEYCGMNQMLLSGSKDSTIRVWKWIKNQLYCVQRIPAHNASVTSILMTETARGFYSVSTDKQLKLWKKNGESNQWKQSMHQYIGEKRIQVLRTGIMNIHVFIRELFLATKSHITVMSVIRANEVPIKVKDTIPVPKD